MRQRKTKFCSVIYFPCCPDSSAVPGNDPLYGCETDSSSRKIDLRVEPLKWTKQSVCVRIIETGAVIPDKIDCFAAFIPATELDVCRVFA